ncbi:maleylpyruvate isomerase family mycothiol-dependent enzyme [Nocardioides antri]|uniref:maleylpyruvate isomerase family mycothiol-dependent enzyme n=1 Tax=Nocardioides antri TaxID=2607659 RepID=UPI00165FF48A|nr:maleylpyruvate isomerase family mycothiol-dependent enzyme [Nocardioides antri]
MTLPVAAATDRLLHTVDHLPDDDWAADSGCTGWSRAHVIAHVALNAEGLGGAVRGLLDGVPTLMYASNERRDADIATLAAAPPAQVRDRLRTSAAMLDAALADLPTLPDDATFERTPGGVRLSAHVVPLLRLREVEIHHADLLAGYTHADWPTETAVRFLEQDAGRYDGTPVVARATDVGRTFAFGSADVDSPVVTGSASALAWWATGRDPGGLLTSSTGTLPRMEGR